MHDYQFAWRNIEDGKLVAILMAYDRGLIRLTDEELAGLEWGLAHAAVGALVGRAEKKLGGARNALSGTPDSPRQIDAAAKVVSAAAAYVLDAATRFIDGPIRSIHSGGPAKSKHERTLEEVEIKRAIRERVHAGATAEDAAASLQDFAKAATGEAS